MTLMNCRVDKPGSFAYPGDSRQ